METSQLSATDQAIRWGIFVLVVGVLIYAAFFLRKRFPIVREFLQFLRERKMWWLTPVAAVFFLLALLVIVTEGSIIGIFIYPIF